MESTKDDILLRILTELEKLLNCKLSDISESEELKYLNKDTKTECVMHFDVTGHGTYQGVLVKETGSLLLSRLT